MTDSYLSPDVYWYGQSPQALPPSFGEGLIENEARIQQYRDAGLHAEADRQAELVVRHKESMAQQALAQYYFPMGDFETLLRQHFPRRIDPGEYQGEGNQGVPNEVLKKLVELRSQKLSVLEEELLEAHKDELIFDKVKFWIADDGEVLVVASKRFGELKHWYLLAQWRPDGQPLVRPEDLAQRQELEELQAQEAKAKKIRQRMAFVVAYFAWLALCLTLYLVALVNGKVLYSLLVVSLWSSTSLLFAKHIKKLQ